MDITLVSPYDPFPRGTDDRKAQVGGVERVFAETSRRLAARGHAVTVVTSSDQVRTPTLTAHGDREPVVIRMPRRATVVRSPIADLASQLPRRSDIIHVAATYPFTTPSVLRRARRLGIPSVLDFHFEPDPVTPFGRAAASAYRYVGPPTYRLADVVLLRSTAYGQNAPSLRKVPEARWRIVPNGIDPSRFGPGATSSDGTAPLLFVGRLVPYKGLRHLLDALALLPTAPPLLVVGDGPLRGELEAQAKRLGVDARFLGRVEDEALPDLYRSASLTVLPSVGKQECFGITLLESMACGTPVVASDIPGVADVARLGGLTAPPGDHVALAQAIAEALHAGAVPRGAALAQRVQKEYSWDTVASILEQVYTDLLDGQNGPAGANPVRSRAAVTG